MDIDLLDRRGRLTRLAIASAIGLAITLVLMKLIVGVAARPNPDAISQVSPILLGIAMFAVISYVASLAITALTKKKRAGT